MTAGSLARFLFPAKQKFHISDRAGIYIKFTEAFASVSAVFRDQRDGVNLMRCSGDGGNMNYSPLLRQADGRARPPFLGLCCHEQLFLVPETSLLQRGFSSRFWHLNGTAPPVDQARGAAAILSLPL